MLGDMRPVMFSDYVNFPNPASAAHKASRASLSTPVSSLDEEEEDSTPPPLPPRLPRSFLHGSTASLASTNPFRSPNAVGRTQSLALEVTVRDVAAMDPCHKRRSLRLNCGGGLLAPPSPAVSTATVDFSASCPATPIPSTVSGSITFNIPSASSTSNLTAPPVDIRFQVNVSASNGAISGSSDVGGAQGPAEETQKRFRYPFQPLIVAGSRSTSPPTPSSSSRKFETNEAQQQQQQPWRRAAATTAEDAEIISATQKRLRDSGFYYEGVTWKDAIGMLTDRPEGTFLVRDSQDAKFLFSLSVQTKRGPTSVRIHYSDGLFYFDAARGLARGAVPREPCVVALVDHYVSVCDTGSLRSHVWLDKNGDTFDQVRLTTPLLRRPPTLTHAARLAFNKAAPTGSLERELLLKRLPSNVRKFVEEYPSTR